MPSEHRFSRTLPHRFCVCDRSVRCLSTVVTAFPASWSNTSVINVHVDSLIETCCTSSNIAAFLIKSVEATGEWSTRNIRKKYSSKAVKRFGRRRIRGCKLVIVPRLFLYSCGSKWWVNWVRFQQLWSRGGSVCYFRRDRRNGDVFLYGCGRCGCNAWCHFENVWRYNLSGSILKR